MASSILFHWQNHNYMGNIYLEELYHLTYGLLFVPRNYYYIDLLRFRTKVTTARLMGTVVADLPRVANI
jgi:hypothetical protein